MDGLPRELTEAVRLLLSIFYLKTRFHPIRCCFAAELEDPASHISVAAWSLDYQAVEIHIIDAAKSFLLSQHAIDRLGQFVL